MHDAGLSAYSWDMPHPLGRSHRFASLICALLLCAMVLGGCAASGPGSISQTRSGQSSGVATSTGATGTAPALEPSATLEATSPGPAPASSGAPVPAPFHRDPTLYPDPRLTPGDVLHVTAAQVSVPGYASKVRNVPVAEKREVYAEYHLAYPQATGAYECDHFIPLCLGGSNSIKNLWPESAPQFHWKDGLEVYLWHEVRAGTIGLAEAQREMRTDWYAYWVKAGKPGSAVDADSAAAQAAVAPVGESSSSTLVGWSVSGTRYHYLWCRFFKQIKPANRRTGTIAQALAAGKTPCKVCRPPK